MSIHVLGDSNYTMNQTDTIFSECHVITPYGEDLMLTEHSEYPGIRLLDASLCTIVIRINKSAIENWTIYGRVSTFGCKEVRYPACVYGTYNN